MLKKKLISILITIMIGTIIFYFMLPAINIHSMSFWFFLIFIFAIYSTTDLLISANEVQTWRKVPKRILIGFSMMIFVGLGMPLINLCLSPLFHAKEYSNRIAIDQGKEFIKEIEPVDFSKLPLLDKASSEKLGDRVMGQMPELVSQFYVSDLYSQINYNDSIIRVTPLEYNGLFKYFSNRKDGVKGYITVDSVTGKSNLKKLDKGMKYVDSAWFNENLNRHLRFSYPTKIFGEKTFEIDNEGNPYWIVPTIKYKGIGLKAEINSVIILNPIDGSSKEYKVEDVPTWVDHVYSASLIIEQVNDWGKYKQGFWNASFGQKNVVQTTEGYNYIAMNDDVYLYTGITSVSTDESNIGFILTNMRTKQTNFYKVPGAEEYSAMESAKGQVQQMNYKASFPLLINLNNRATYLLSLKDAAGLVKMYAFVDVEDYQKVEITDASEGIQKASENYLNKIWSENANITTSNIEKEIQIKKLSTANIDGTTYYYIIDMNDQKYKCSIKIAKDILPFLEENDQIKIGYREEQEMIQIEKISMK